MKTSSKTIKLLKRAHAIETGAFEAYEGHANSVKDPQEKYKIQEIQKDEWFHRQAIEWFLIDLKSEPNPFLDFVLYLIGRSISLSCYVMGRKAAMWGAKIMESLGSNIYKELAKVARNEGYPAMAVELDHMQKTEEEHERFFKSKLI